MLKNKIKYIVSDVDGTLLTDPIKGLSKKTIEVINQYQKQTNNALTLATGRHIDMIKQYIDLLKIKLPVITSNGSVVKYVDKKECIVFFSIKRKLYEALVKDLKAIGIKLAVQTIEDVYIETGTNVYKILKKYNEISKKEYCVNLIITETLDGFLNINQETKILEITASISEEKQREKLKVLMKKYPDFSIKKTAFDEYDINNKKASKGNALKEMCKKLGINRNEILAYGDNQNDIDMFKTAGYSATFSYGFEELKKHASEIIEDSEIDDAVANHIYKNFIE